MVMLLGLAAAVLYGTGDFLGGLATRAGLAWGITAGLIGGAGVIIFYRGLAAGPMSVVAPVSGLVSTVLPVAAALAEGGRPGVGVYAGAVLCLVAIVMTSAAGHGD